MSELSVSVGLAREFRAQVRSTSRGTSVEGAGRLVDIPASRLPSQERAVSGLRVMSEKKRQRQRLVCLIAYPSDFGKGWAKLIGPKRERKLPVREI